MPSVAREGAVTMLDHSDDNIQKQTLAASLPKGTFLTHDVRFPAGSSSRKLTRRAGLDPNPTIEMPGLFCAVKLQRCVITHEIMFLPFTAA
jgi:hypothetical protein